MSDKKENNNLSPWQEKHLEYEAEKREAQDQENLLEEENLSEYDLLTDDELVNDINQEDLEENSDLLEDEEDTEKNSDSVKKKDRSPILPIFKKMWWLLLIFCGFFFVNLYNLSPISKVGDFRLVTDDIHESPQELADASGLRVNDKIIHIYRSRARLEKNITDAFPRIKKTSLSISFPNNVNVAIEEYKTTAYIKKGNEYYPVLESGHYSTNDKIAADKLNKKFPILDGITDFDEIKTFMECYNSLSDDIRSQISTVKKTPTKATSDFVSIEMRDGNLVKVPISEMNQKMPYYASVKKNLQGASVIDMEAGIFSTAR